MNFGNRPKSFRAKACRKGEPVTAQKQTEEFCLLYGEGKGASEKQQFATLTEIIDSDGDRLWKNTSDKRLMNILTAEG